MFLWLRNARNLSYVETVTHVVLCSLAACNFYKCRACLILRHVVVQTGSLLLLKFGVVELIDISHSFMCLVGVPVSARTLARNAKIYTIYYRFTTDCCSTHEAQNLKWMYYSRVTVFGAGNSTSDRALP